MSKRVLHVRSFRTRANRSPEVSATCVCGNKRVPYVLREPTAKGFVNLGLTKDEKKLFRWCKRCLAGGKRLARQLTQDKLQ